MLKHGQNLTRIINHDLLVALGSLEGCLHIALNTGFSHNVLEGICTLGCAFIYHPLVEKFYLFRGYPSGISEDMCKILAVYISSDGVFLYGNSGENIGVLHYERNSLFGYIRSHSCTDILTI